MHAFVPGNIVDNHEDKLSEGNICKISNFSVKEYKPDEKFRCINNDRKIILTTYSKVHKLDQDHTLIAKNVFDFYDLCDLSDIANDNLYLTGMFSTTEYFDNTTHILQSILCIPLIFLERYHRSDSER